MNTKWLLAGALATAAVLGVSSPALADDYCAVPVQRPRVEVEFNVSHGGGGYAYSRPYDSYDRRYDYDDDYAPRYDDYPQRSYTRPYYDDGYARRGYVGTVHEDHIRTRFNPFPFPHIEKRVIHHYHPVYSPY